MRDLVSVPIALVLGLIVAIGALFALPAVVTEIQPAVIGVFDDLIDRPTQTMEDNIGVAKIIVASWAGLMLFVFIFLAPATNAGSAITHWSFKQLARGWSRILGGQTFYQRIGSIAVGLWSIVVVIGRIVLVAPVHVFLVIVGWVFGPVGRGWERTHNVRFSLCSDRRSQVLSVLLLLGALAAGTLK